MDIIPDPLDKVCHMVSPHQHNVLSQNRMSGINQYRITLNPLPNNKF